MRPFSNVSTLSNHWPDAGMAQHPEYREARAAFGARAKSSTRVTIASWALASSAASARLTISRSGRFTSARAERQLLLLRERQPLGAAADVEAEPELDDRRRSGRARPSSRAGARSPARRLRRRCRRCARRARCPARSPAELTAPGLIELRRRPASPPAAWRGTLCRAATISACMCSSSRPRRCRGSM